MTKSTAAHSIYRGRDPRELPAYTAAEAARYLDVPASTIRAWCFAQTAPSRKADFKPVLKAADVEGRSLSFFNLVELFVLASLTRSRGVDLRHIRRLLARIGSKKSQHPLADETLATDGAGQLFVEQACDVFNVSNEWQKEMLPVVERHLRRLERDKHKLPVKLFPFSTKNPADDRRSVVIDPRVSFGRPWVAGTGVPVDSVLERFEAGDEIKDLAADFDCSPALIEDALRYVRRAA